jgi:hypothetical protein
MKPHPPRPGTPPACRPSSRSGIALITVLLLIALLTLTLLSYFYLVRSDRQRAHSFMESMKSRLLIESALEEVKAKIMDGSEMDRPLDPTWKAWTSDSEPGGFGLRARAHMTASPGLMEVRYFESPVDRDNASTDADAFGPDKWFRDPFNPKYNPRWIPLFSYRWFAPSIRFLQKTGEANTLANVSEPNTNYNPGVQFNLNTIQNPFYPGELYLSGSPDRTVGFKYAKDASDNFATTTTQTNFLYAAGESSLDRPVYVQWLPIYRTPGKPAIYTENGTTFTNRVIGRYAYWVDVENTKINLNTSERLYDRSELNSIAGVSDAVAGAGNKFFEQTGVINGALVNQSLKVRYEIEKNLIKTGNMTNTVSGNGTPDNTAANTYYNKWFGWGSGRSDGDRPYAADHTMVDWRAITGMRPRGDGTGTNVTTEALIGTYDPTAHRFNTPLEVFSLQDPQVQLSDAKVGNLQMAAMRRTFGLSTTIYGYEDERDPIGKPRIDLGRLQQEGISAAPSSAYRLLFRRLAQNGEYYKAYYPDGYPAQGGRTLAAALGPFAGNASGNATDGSAVVEQMLVNIVAASRPHAESPTSVPGWTATMTNRGIWPAKSMPYVAEVATRARSALYLIPAVANGNITSIGAGSTPGDGVSSITVGNFIEPILDGNGTVTGNRLRNTTLNGKQSLDYLKEAVVDLAFAFANPNPFATNIFSGSFAATANVGGANVTLTDANLPSGSYAGVPLYKIDGDSVDDVNNAGYKVDGTPVVFTNLGGSPINADKLLTDKQWLKIEGWTIRDSSGALFHQVPMRQLGANVSPPRPWWRMAAAGVNYGAPTNAASAAAAAYRNSFREFATNGNIAVGWFTPKTINEAVSQNVGANFTVSSNLFLTDSGIVDGATDSAVIAKVRWALTNSQVSLLKDSIVERIQCIDPVVGHRTGNDHTTATTGLPGSAGRGHFYGAAGHPWRHFEYFRPGPPTLQNVVQTSPGTTTTTTVTNTVEVPYGNSFVKVPVVSKVSRTTGGSSTVVPQLVSPPGPLPALTDRFSDPTKTTNWSQTWTRGGVFVDGLVDIDREYPGVGAYTYANGSTAGMPTLHGLFAGAPKGEPFVSVGEVGFVHSGLMQRPINLTGRIETTSTNSVGHPANGPSMAMLIDLLTPPTFRTASGATIDSPATWSSAISANVSNTPSNPRRGTWNVNVSVATDSYMALRQGNSTGGNPSALPARVAWSPSAFFFQRAIGGNSGDHETGLESEGLILEPFLSPFPRYRRGWESWLAIIGADFTPNRSIGEGGFGGVGNAVGYSALGMTAGTWAPGRGVVPANPRYMHTPVVTFDPQLIGPSALLAIGKDGRDWHDSFSSDGYLSGLFAADQNLHQITSGSGARAFQSATRFAIMPMKHFASELNMDPGSTGSRLDNVSTALNMSRHVYTSLGNQFGEGPAGPYVGNGMFKNAPIALAANQVSTSANAFTIHVVAQAIQDVGKKRILPGGATDPNSGVGFIDADDKVTAEQWGRVVLARVPDMDSGGNIPIDPNTGGPKNKYKVLYYRVLENAK